MIKFDPTQAEKATDKAWALRPPMDCISDGQYRVRGSKGDWYDVKCWWRDGEVWFACGCRATVICYHSIQPTAHFEMFSQRVEGGNVIQLSDAA